MYGVGHKENPGLRLLKALPLLVVFYFVLQHAPPLSAMGTAEAGGQAVARLTDFFAFGSTLYSGVTYSAGRETYGVIADFVLVYGIWLVESARRANLLTPPQA